MLRRLFNEAAPVTLKVKFKVSPCACRYNTNLNHLPLHTSFFSYEKIRVFADLIKTIDFSLKDVLCDFSFSSEIVYIQFQLQTKCGLQ
jgi:hypothetical protein